MKISDDAMHHRAFVERVTAQCARIAHCGGLSIALVGAASAASSSLGSSQSFRRSSRLKPLLPKPFHRIGRSRLCYAAATPRGVRSEEHTSELQSLMRTSYAVFFS